MVGDLGVRSGTELWGLRGHIGINMALFFAVRRLLAPPSVAVLLGQIRGACCLAAFLVDRALVIPRQCETPPHPSSCCRSAAGHANAGRHERLLEEFAEVENAAIHERRCCRRSEQAAPRTIVDADRERPW